MGFSKQEFKVKVQQPVFVVVICHITTYVDSIAILKLMGCHANSLCKETESFILGQLALKGFHYPRLPRLEGLQSSSTSCS